MEIEIYWDDLSEAKQEELIEAGFSNVNVMSGCFPVTTVFVDGEDEEDL